MIGLDIIGNDDLVATQDKSHRTMTFQMPLTYSADYVPKIQDEEKMTRKTAKIKTI